MYDYWEYRLGIPLTKDPTRATDPIIAAEIMVLSMKEGDDTSIQCTDDVNKTGCTKAGNINNSLSHYINGTSINFVGARHIINPGASLGNAQEFAGYANKYLTVLKACSYSSSSGSGQVNSKFISPLPIGMPTISSPFGPRAGGFHPGIDLAVPNGTKVWASNGGEVNFAGWSDGYGYLVVIYHGNHVWTYYGHNEKILVATGDKVSQKQVIALSDTTGHSTGPHVHFEFREGDGGQGTSVNPTKYVTQY